MWALSCSFWWFVTGHQASLSSIPWNAAFVGFRGSHPTVALPAVMVGANIYISQILHTGELCFKMVILMLLSRLGQQYGIVEYHVKRSTVRLKHCGANKITKIMQ